MWQIKTIVMKNIKVLIITIMIIIVIIINDSDL